jgi:hypothetical protein
VADPTIGDFDRIEDWPALVGMHDLRLPFV